MDKDGGGSHIAYVAGLACAAFIIQAVISLQVVSNTGSVADRLRNFVGRESPLGSESGGKCNFVAPIPDWERRAVTAETNMFKLHFDAWDSTKAYMEVRAGFLESGIEFGITAMDIGGGFSHFQSTDGAGFVWSMKLAEDKASVLYFKQDLTVRARPGSDYRKLWEDSRLPGLRASLPFVTQYVGKSCTAESYFVDIGSLVAAGFHTGAEQSFPLTTATPVVHHKGIKSLKHNIDVTVTYFSPKAGERAAAELGARFCIFELPFPAMIGRRADARAGYFFTDFRTLGDYSDEDTWPGKGKEQMYSPTVRLINRMKVGPSRCAAEFKRDPDKLHFYIDPTTPKALWEATKQGIGMWNSAFVGAGYGVQAHRPDDDDWPENYDHADICFNTISWSAGSPGQTFAIGQSVKDPRSGEMLKANIIFTLGWLKIWMGRRIVYGAMDASRTLGTELRKLSEAGVDDPEMANWAVIDSFEDIGENESIPAEWTDSSPQVWAMQNNPSPEESLSFLEQGIRDVTAHEVGHTIGLRHNFRGSLVLSFEDLQRESKVKEFGLTSSVMDYNAFNVISEATRTELKAKYPGDIPDAKDAPFFTTVIGAYDKWVIEYGYKKTPEEESDGGCFRGWCTGDATLATILDKYVDQGLEFATDETRDDFDPYTVLRDLGKNPIDQYEESYKVAAEGFKNMFERNMGNYKDWTQLYFPFRVYRGNVHGSARALIRFIGGIKTMRKNGKTHKGIPCGPTDTDCLVHSNMPVLKADMDRALGLIMDAIVDTQYDPPAWFQDEAVKSEGPTRSSIYVVYPVNVQEEMNSFKIGHLTTLLNTKRIGYLRLSEQMQGLEAGSLVKGVLKTCSDRLLGIDKTVAEAREFMKTTTQLHDVRAAYFSALSTLSSEASDQILKAIIKAEGKRMYDAIAAILVEIQADDGREKEINLEEWFLRGPTLSAVQRLSR